MFKRIVIACDSFKGCLSSADVNSAVEAGVRAAGVADAEVVKFPLADGGEGTVDSLVQSCGGEYVEREVCGPLAWGDFSRPCGQSRIQSCIGRSGQSDSVVRVRARYALIRDGRVAVIETAAASGLTATPSDMPLATALRPDIAKANISRAIASFLRPQD